MNTIVIVLGKPNSGKSSTMVSLVNQMLANGFTITKDHSPRRSQYNKMYSGLFNNRPTGINMRGDVLKEVIADLTTLIQGGNELIIVAARLKMESVIMRIANIYGFNVVILSPFTVVCLSGTAVPKMSIPNRMSLGLPLPSVSVTANGIDVNDICAESILKLIQNL